MDDKSNLKKQTGSRYPKEGSEKGMVNAGMLLDDEDLKQVSGGLTRHGQYSTGPGFGKGLIRGK